MTRIFRISLNIEIKKYNSRYTSCFSKAKLKRGKGYFYLDPMPTEKELDLYYKDIYWQSRNDKSNSINERDLIHFHIIKKCVPFFFKSQKNILNFGAGHGGIPHLFWILGFNITNIEPSGISKLYPERWMNLKSINEIKNQKFDLIYGSHSLEHVQDIDILKKQIKKIIKPNGLLFWEVPNAVHPENGAILGQVQIPHTYYFFKEFFDDWFNDVIFNESYSEKYKYIVGDYNKLKNPSGEVIIALGKID